VSAVVLQGAGTGSGPHDPPNGLFIDVALQPTGGIEHMSDDHPKPSTEADAELEREIRAGRKFSVSEAIGRLAGPGMMKGVSPVTRRGQAVAAIQEYLGRHLGDARGVLSDVLLRQVSESALFLHDFDHPLAVLAGCVRRVLDSEYELKDLVREADVEWGRVFGERPRFERDGCLPAPDDPYTLESVRAALTQLVGGLAAGEE
jgi:hypothetical protein